MFKRMLNKLRDMATIKSLCEEAERQARLLGEDLPGAEHYLLSALALEEGSARRAFERVGADPAAVRGAIAAQHSQALAGIGIALPPDAVPDRAPLPPKGKLFSAKPSGQAVMQALHGLRQKHQSPRLLGAHVLLAVAAMSNSSAARALKGMQINLAALAAAAETELRSAA